MDRRGLAPKSAGQQQPELGGSPLTMAGWWQQFEADLTAAERALKRQRQAAVAAGNPWPPQPETTSHPGARDEAWQSAARLDQLLGQAADATKRIAARNTEQQASAQYAARMERETQTLPEPTLQARVQEQAEAER